MKVVGSAMMFMGGMGFLLGVLFILLSLKNVNDLGIWMAAGILIGGAGGVMSLIGWAISYSESRTQTDQDASP